MRLICRVCLQTSSQFIDMESPFEMEDAEITYLDCFRACTQLEIQTENVPQCLCFACCSELKVAYSFLLKALEAERKLQAKQLSMLEEHILDETEEQLQQEQSVDDESLKVEFFEIDVVDDVCTMTEEHVQDDNDGPKIADDNTAEILETESNAEENYVPDEQHLDEAQIAINEITEDANVQLESEFLVQAVETEELEFLSTNGDETVECTKCGQLIASDAYNEHVDVGNCTPEAIFQCSNCSQNFETKAELLQHACIALSTNATIDGNSAASKVLSCSICSKTFSHAVALNTHLKYHLRKEVNLKAKVCNICGKTFSSQYYRQIHQKHVHRDVRKLFQCSHCAKMYFSKTALDSHMRIHTGETKVCPVCNKQFVRQYELNVHMRFHTGDYPFNCEVCGKRFAIKGHLRSHMWKHQGLKLQCDDCGKLFTSTKALQEHSFTHTEMPYRCSYCEKGYPSKQKYKVHLRRAHFVELDAHELEKVTGNTPKPLQRKKRTLVQADSVMKEVEVKTKRDVSDEQWSTFIDASKDVD